MAHIIQCFTRTFTSTRFDVKAAQAVLWCIALVVMVGDWRIVESTISYPWSGTGCLTMCCTAAADHWRPPGCLGCSSDMAFATHIVTLIEEYSQQYNWRSWPVILDALPGLDGQFVLDLGCGIGDLAADLSARGARVIGVDLNEELITYSNDRHIANAQFRIADLCTFRDPGIQADGIWSGFTAAYFPSLRDTVALWLTHLRPGGWLLSVIRSSCKDWRSRTKGIIICCSEAGPSLEQQEDQVKDLP